MKKVEFKVMVNAVEGEAIEANNTTSFKLSETKGLQFLIDIGADAGNPAIQVIKANPKEVIEFAKRTGAKAVNGFSVKVGGETVYNLYVLSNGAVAVENLFTQLADIAGHAVAEAGFLRTSIKKLQQFAHAVRQNIAAYKNSYGLDENLSPYFNGLNKEKYVSLLKQVIVGDHLPEEVALMDVH